MSDPQSGNNTDPFAQWRGVRDTYMEAWAKAMAEGVNTDAYAKASGAFLDAYLTASTPFHEALEKAMLEALKQLAMPSRSDIVSLAERMTNVEMRLDDLDAKLNQIAAGLAKLTESQAAQLQSITAQLHAMERQPVPAAAGSADTPGAPGQEAAAEKAAAGASKTGKKGLR